MDVKILDNEVLEDLQYNNLFILQKNDGFRFGTDAIILSYFTKVKSGDSIVDLGTGTGIIPILLTQKEKNIKVHAFEIQEDMADMASRSIRWNGLEEKVKVYSKDYKLAHEIVGKGQCSLVVANPPYGKSNATILPNNQNKVISKHELYSGIEECISVASVLLRFGGRFSLCFPSIWLAELCVLLRKNSMEAKRLRLVQSMPDKKPYLILLEAIKGGKPYLDIEKPLLLMESEGKPSEEYKTTYHIK